MQPASFLIWLSGSAIAGLAASALTIRIFDPLWHYGGPLLPAPSFQVDERRQKTNRLVNTRPEFDGVLLGNSRVRPIHASAFRRMRVLNYSASSMHPDEYEGFLDVACGVRTPTTIVLAVDFPLDGALPPGSVPLGAREYAAEAATGRWADLFNVSALRLSLSAARCMLRGCADSYAFDAQYEFVPPPMPTPAERQRRIEKDVAMYSAPFPSLDLSRLPYMDSLHAIRRRWPSTRIVVFTNPVSVHMFAIVARQNRMSEYGAWLRGLIAIFGEIWEFSGVNPVTADSSNYFDAHHYSPAVGRMIAARIEGRDAECVQGFGVRLTAANLEAYLQSARDAARRLIAAPIPY